MHGVVVEECKGERERERGVHEGEHARLTGNRDPADAAVRNLIFLCRPKRKHKKLFSFGFTESVEI